MSRAKQVYVVEWNNGESYDDARSEAVAVFTAKTDAERFAKLAASISNRWKARYQAWLDGDDCGRMSNRPNFRSKYDPQRNTDARTSQFYAVLKQTIPLDPPALKRK
jgi:hypothetical protein